jgi:trigger factor
MSTHPDSVGDLLGRMLVQRSPGMLSLDGPVPVELPPFEAPSLEGLTVAVPQPAPVTEEDVLARFEELCHLHAPRRDRAPGEEVVEGDEVLLDVVAYSNGRLIPFSARVDWWAEMAPEPLLPGFFEELLGVQVGLTVPMDITLPDTYVVESLRGTTARFIVEVKAAREVALVDPESPELLARLGLGSTLDETLDSIAEALFAEREEEAERELRERVLDALVQRTEAELPASLVDKELRIRWAQLEYPALVAKDFSAEELEEAWEGWRTDGLSRLDAEWRLRAAMALRAIIERDDVQPDPEDVEAFCDAIAESTGSSREELQGLLESNPTLAERFEHLLMHGTALDYVLSKVELTSDEEAEPTSDAPAPAEPRPP